MTNERVLLKVAEAAAELNVSIHTARAWVGQRRLASVRLGRAVRVPRSEVLRLIEQGTVPARRGLAK